MKSALILSAILLLLGACAQSSLVAVLTPGEGEEVGGIVVLDAVTEAPLQTIVEANQQAVAGSGRLRLGPIGLDAANVGSLMAGLPLPPVKFVLYFETGSTSLVEESRPVIEALFSEVNRRPGADIEIVGHTNSLGEASMNDAISRERAEAVKQALVGMGLSQDIMQAYGRGERELLVQTGDEVAEPLNSRVEITVR